MINDKQEGKMKDLTFNKNHNKIQETKMCNQRKKTSFKGRLKRNTMDNTSH